MKTETKDAIEFFAALVTLIFTLTLTFCAAYWPPRGVVDSSMLVVVGEFLSFVSAIWGISEYTKIQLHKINHGTSDK